MGEVRSLSVVIPNYNGAHLLDRHLPKVLDALARYPGVVEVIAVDDCSTDGSLATLAKYRSVRVVRRESNVGFPASCNAGAREAQGEIIFFLNTDASVAPDFFEFFSAHFDDPDVFAVTPLGLRLPGNLPLDGAKSGYWRHGTIRVTRNSYPPAGGSPGQLRSFTVQGAYFFVHAGKFREMGGFDETFSPYLFEETDLTYRALKRGWKVNYEPRAVAYHEHNVTIGAMASRFRRRSLSIRNRIMFVWKNVQATRLLVSHTAWLALKLLLLQPATWVGFSGALKRRGEVMRLRRIEASAARRSDLDILREFEGMG